MPADQVAVLREALSGRYRLDREIGRGGAATVYVARDLRHPRLVAIKVLSPDVAALLGPEQLSSEINTLSSLNHPHVLPLIDSGEVGGLPYFVTPYLEQGTLRDRITRERQLPVEEVVRITYEVADALVHAHAHGVTHGDIKPANILLNDGHAIVADFGIAALLAHARDQGITDLRMGTPAYMSPEQHSGLVALDGRSDVYSLGLVCYEMLTGSLPFHGESVEALRYQHTSLDPPAIRLIRPTVPAPLEKIVLRALAKYPADRFANAAAMRDALSGAGIQKPSITHGRRRTVWIGGGLLLGGLVLGTALRLRDKTSGTVLGTPPSEVAVLYFRDESPSRDLGALAEGLTADVVAELHRGGGLRVRSLDAVRPFRDRSVPVDSVARALGIRTLISGTLTLNGDQVEMRVQLSDASTGLLLSEGIARAPRVNALGLRDTVIFTIARTLKERLGLAVRLEATRQETRSSEAWELLHRADRLREAAAVAGMPDSALAAQTLLEADSALALAERLDPKWLAPTVRRGWVRFDLADIPMRGAPMIGEVAGRSNVDWLVDATAFADKALARDSSNAEAFELRGAAYLRLALLPRGSGLAPESALGRAESDLRRAVQASGLEAASAWVRLSRLLWLVDKKAEARHAAEQAYRADVYGQYAPEVLQVLFVDALGSGQNDASRRWCREGRRLRPGDWRFVFCQLQLMALDVEHPADANTVWRVVTSPDGVSVWSRDPWVRAPALLLVAAALANVGLPDSAIRVSTRARAAEADPNTGELLQATAWMWARVGNRGRLFAVLDSLVALDSGYRVAIRDDPFFRSLSTDPAFTKLLGSPR